MFLDFDRGTRSCSDDDLAHDGGSRGSLGVGFNWITLGTWAAPLDVGLGLGVRLAPGPCLRLRKGAKEKRC